MESQTKRYLYIIFLTLLAVNGITYGAFFQQAPVCKEFNCAPTLVIAFFSGLICLGLSLAGILMVHQKPVWVNSLGILLTAISYVYFYSPIAFYSQYFPLPKFLLLLNFAAALAAFVYTLGFGLVKPGTLKPGQIFLIASILALGSAYHTLKHMADGGCDGGTCAILIFFLPVYAIGYLLIFLPLYQNSQKPTPLTRGFIFATIGFLFNWFINAAVFAQAQKDLRDDWSDPIFIMPCLSGAIFLTFLLRLTRLFAPEPAETTETTEITT